MPSLFASDRSTGCLKSVGSKFQHSGPQRRYGNRLLAGIRRGRFRKAQCIVSDEGDEIELGEAPTPRPLGIGGAEDLPLLVDEVGDVLDLLALRIPGLRARERFVIAVDDQERPLRHPLVEVLQRSIGVADAVEVAPAPVLGPRAISSSSGSMKSKGEWLESVMMNWKIFPSCASSRSAATRIISRSRTPHRPGTRQ